MIKSTFNRTKIIATVGPAIESELMLTKLILCGVDVFRFNFSHSDHKSHLKVLNRLKRINKKLNTNIAALVDLQGPKIRIGDIVDGKIVIKKGQVLTFTNKKVVGHADLIYVSYKFLARDVEIDDKILVDDGNLEMKVISTDKKGIVKAKVTTGGVLKSRKGMNLPDTKVSVPAFSDKDKKDVVFALEQNVEWIALSFVRSAADVLELKEFIKKRGKNTSIISKIEKPEAVKNIDEIIRVSEGIMVARGDLGVEIKLEEVPKVQKMIVRKANVASKPVIIATQMMESMITKHIPTRAETNDVANAVLDGADAMMLSAETSVGKYPIEVVKNMVKTITAIEKMDTIYNKDLHPTLRSSTFYNDCVIASACSLATETKAKAIIGITTSGYTGFRLASHRPKANIFIFSNERMVMRRLNLVWGVRSFFYNKFVSTDQTIIDIKNILSKYQHLKPGDIYINTSSMPMKERRRTNMVKLSIFE